MKAVQRFSDEYLEQCSAMSTEQIVQFLDDFRIIHGASSSNEKPTSKLISIKVPEDLLRAFRTKSVLHDVPYQTQIKRLMLNWLKGD